MLSVWGEVLSLCGLSLCSYREASEEDPWCSDEAPGEEEEEEETLAPPSAEEDNRPTIEKVIRMGPLQVGVGHRAVGGGQPAVGVGHRAVAVVVVC